MDSVYVLAAGLAALAGLGLAAVFARQVTAADPGKRSIWQQKLDEILRQSLGAGFQNHDIELTIKGWCADCAH